MREKGDDGGKDNKDNKGFFSKGKHFLYAIKIILEHSLIIYKVLR